MSAGGAGFFARLLAAPERRHRLALLVLSLLFFVPGWKALPPTDRDESRFAQSARQMLTSSNFVDVRLQDRPRYNQPIGVYWLQAGAFAEEREADNLKARIALTGLEASVRAVSIPDKGTLYRVRLGPYQSLDDANRIKSALSQNGVGAAIIRTTDEAKTQ